jgi:uncharacterized protein with PQ loop repeat
MTNGFTETIGIAAGVCTSLALLPQLIKLLKYKKAEDLSLVYLINRHKKNRLIRLIYCNRKNRAVFVVLKKSGHAQGHTFCVPAPNWYIRQHEHFRF